MTPRPFPRRATCLLVALSLSLGMSASVMPAIAKPAATPKLSGTYSFVSNKTCMSAQDTEVQGMVGTFVFTPAKTANGFNDFSSSALQASGFVLTGSASDISAPTLSGTFEIIAPNPAAVPPTPLQVSLDGQLFAAVLTDIVGGVAQHAHLLSTSIGCVQTIDAILD